MDDLIRLIQQNSLRRGEFKLASGRTSDYLIDLKATTLHPTGAVLIAGAILELVRENHMKIDAIGGMAIGAVPIVAAIVAFSTFALPIKGFYVRESPKLHGDQAQVYGLLQPGDHTVLIEDVTTTGGSVLKAVEAVRAAGASVSHVITVVDRLEGASDNLRRHGVTLTPLLTRDDLL